MEKGLSTGKTDEDIKENGKMENNMGQANIEMMKELNWRGCFEKVKEYRGLRIQKMDYDLCLCVCCVF